MSRARWVLRGGVLIPAPKRILRGGQLLSVDGSADEPDPSDDTTAARVARSRAAGIPVGSTGYEHVGVPVGTQLTVVRAAFVTSRDDQVLENVDLYGLVTIRHKNCIIRNSRITNNGDPKIRVDTANGASNFVIEDSTIRGTRDDDSGTAIGYGAYTATRVWVTQVEDAFRLGIRSTIDTCLADGQSIGLLPDGTRLHTDGVQSNGGNNPDGVYSAVRNSSLLAVRTNGSKGNSAVILGSEGAQVGGVNQGSPLRNVIVENNYFDNGSYSVMQKGPENEQGFMENIVYRNNLYAGNGRFGDICCPRWAVGRWLTFQNEKRVDGSNASISYWDNSSNPPSWYVGP